MHFASLATFFLLLSPTHAFLTAVLQASMEIELQRLKLSTQASQDLASSAAAVRQSQDARENELRDVISSLERQLAEEKTAHTRSCVKVRTPMTALRSSPLVLAMKLLGVKLERFVRAHNTFASSHLAGRGCLQGER
jgi:hypothetical protein